MISPLSILKYHSFNPSFPMTGNMSFFLGGGIQLTVLVWLSAIFVIISLELERKRIVTLPLVV